MVSIIVPVYNVEEYLRECVDSVLNQTYSDVEVILVDDGSTDQSGNICDEYAKMDSRIKVIHKKNGGVSSARNTGIETASGERIIFVDSDDCIHPRLLESYRELDDDSVTLLCDYTTGKEEWKRFSTNDFQEHMEFVAREKFMKLFYKDYMNPPFNKYFRADIIREHQIRFPEDMSLGEDLIFNMKYLAAVKCDYQIMHGPFYYYRENRAGSLSTGGRADLLDIQKKLFASIKNFLDETGIWTEENAAIYYSMYWDRLHLTWKTSGKLNPQMLQDTIWSEIWSECSRRGLATWKRRVKKLTLDMRRMFT